ncbi:MAG: PDDEXK nuclease domain-containing protein [Methyloprofundus sp.]|nr:PDDEXK nuclease domain-containing protein [Methyloprofundus sp.]
MSKIIDQQYVSWIASLKHKFQQAQIKAAVQVNRALLQFYWDLGADIIEKQQDSVWGSGFLQQLSKDLRHEFPDVKGFSFENIRQIRRWYAFYNAPDANLVTTCHQNAKALLTQIPWGQNRVIISKCHTIPEALFYVQATIQNGWSRAVLTHQIESQLFSRQGQAVSNFKSKLPKPQSDLAQQLLKDPYDFEFLTLTQDFKEKELERGLLKHITQFLLELGAGFAYIGKQVPIKVGAREFFIDLLFYHIKLRCYVVVELKAVEFEPEFAGKLNFYLNAVDAELKHPLDASSIGILLCKSKDKTVVEYALKNVDAPMGVSEYQITQALPENIKSDLPSVEEIEAELQAIDDETVKANDGVEV